jgi:hypothetical protein
VTSFFRRRRELTQWLAALLLCSWLAPLAVPHTASDDELCIVVVGGSAASATWTASSDADQPHHCVICHSIRSYRTALADCGPAASTLTLQHTCDAQIDVWHRAPAFDRLPARAPPA